MNKRLISGVVVSGVLSLSVLAGCAAPNTGTTTSATDEYSAVEEATLTTRTVTFPSVYFEKISQEEALSTLEGLGATDVVAHDDGSYTATLSLDTYNRIAKELYDSVTSTLDEVVSKGDFPTLESIEYTDDFGMVTIYANRSDIGLDIFSAYAVGVPVIMYRQFAGLPVESQVVYVDQNGDTIKEINIPDDFQQNQSEVQTQQ